MSRAQRTSPGTRNWSRQALIRSALAVFSGRECLGKTLDLAEGGVGAVLQGTEHRVGERLELVVVFEGATLAFRGTVVRVQPLFQAARVGIRLAASGGEERIAPAGHGLAEAPLAGGALRPAGRGSKPVPWARNALPARFNAGIKSPFIAAHDALALRRDRSRLVRALRRKGLPGGRITYDSLLEMLRQRRLSRGLNRVSRELFRALMRVRYPSFPGSAIRGRVVVPGGDADANLLAGAKVMLDRFAVAEVGPCGSFSAEGIPVPDAPVVLPVSIRGPGLVTTEEVLVSLRAGQATDMLVEVRVRAVRGHWTREDDLLRAYRELCAVGGAPGAGA